MEEELKSLI